MSEPRVLTCGDLAGLLGGTVAGECFIFHDPRRQLRGDPSTCLCTPGPKSEWWRENPDAQESCRHITRVVSDRFPGLILELCCECQDRWPGDWESLFDQVAEIEGLSLCA